MKLFSQVWSLARIEAGFFARFPTLFFAAVAVCLIPALYAVIYLSSVWDPSAKTGALPVAIVNLDQGVEYRGHVFNVGREVVSKLTAAHQFGYVAASAEEEARREVRQGRLAFALIIPADFSSNAVPGAQPGAGKLVVYTSEGNSYQSAALARRFADELGHDVNESLNEQRWALVLNDAAGSRQSLERLHDGVNQLRLGATELEGGATQTVKGAQDLSAGNKKATQAVEQLTAGVKTLGAGLRSMDERRARNSELTRFKDGVDALAQGQVEMSRSLGELQAGVLQLEAGVAAFREQTAGSIWVSSQVTEDVDKLAGGLSQVGQGLKTALTGQEKLVDGTNQLSNGAGVLTGGMRSMNQGIRTAARKMPPDSELDELAKGVGALAAGSAILAQGTQKVRTGAQHLMGGLDLLASTLPATGKDLEGSAQGLANSVQPSVEVVAAVQSNGGGIAPNIIAGALWLGASLAVFLVHVRRLPRQAREFSRLARMLGKIFVPSLVVVAQALMVLLLVLFVFNIQVANVGALALTLSLGALAFLLIIVAFTRAMGDAGKALALVFLAVQISSSGGLMPVELSGGLFSQISPWLPMTWVVKAIKASMFGAYDGVWQYPLQFVALAGLAAALAACFIGRWRFVKPSAIRPALDF